MVPEAQEANNSAMFSTEMRAESKSWEISCANERDWKCLALILTFIFIKFLQEHPK